MKNEITRQLPTLILEQLNTAEFLKKYNQVSWIDEHERVLDVEKTEVLANLIFLGSYEIDSSNAPTFNIPYIVFEISNLKQSKGRSSWSLGAPNMRVVGSISNVELLLQSSFDNKGNRVDNFKIIKCPIDIDKLAFHPR